MVDFLKSLIGTFGGLFLSPIYEPKATGIPSIQTSTKQIILVFCIVSRKEDKKKRLKQKLCRSRLI